MTQLNLRNNTIADKLEFGNNHIGNKGAKYLADALKKNKTVTNIYLEGNNIKYEGEQYLAQMLALSSSLTTMIHLKSCQIEAVRNNNKKMMEFLTKGDADYKEGNYNYALVAYDQAYKFKPNFATIRRVSPYML